MKTSIDKINSKVLNEEISLITIKNNNIILELSNYGAMITKLLIDDIDVIVGCNTVDEYIKQPNFFGATIGRYANRIGNGKFKIDGMEYNVSINESPNQLHGGFKGFDKRIWKYEIMDNSVIFSYLSKDMEEGFPGNLNVKVKYTLTEKNEVLIEYFANSDKDTVVSLTNHSYFNINGENGKNIKNQILQINADYISEVDEGKIPTGKLIDIKDSNFDFREERSIDDALENSKIILNRDYDHNYILSNDDDKKVKASIYSPITNIKMELYTSYPCLQIYTGSGFDNFKGKSKDYNNYDSICLEAQYSPNAMNLENMKQPILRKDEDFYEFIKFKFII